ncbi:DISARM system phospholipase D-like protein DrmC [Acidobacteria bacterium AH-259-O06]|nr:DISARM system phospholipase D-like protein DrmC [Acidobacteria bacterium AH-259-O06]
MTESLLGLPAHLRRRLADGLDSGLLSSPYSLASLRSVLGLREGGEDVMAALQELERMGISGSAVTAWIRTVEEVSSRMPRPDLVWSGPEVPGLHARDTRRVYEELLGSAERSIWASSYAYFDGPRAFDVLARRMDARPDLRVTLLLNIQRRRGDTTAGEELVRRFADRFWETDWPGSSRPRVYYDPRSLELDGPAGVLHAKAVVVDDEAVFVTSANLTEAALDRNIEIGLLVRDRALAASVLSHFRGLIDQGLLLPLPMA